MSYDVCCREVEVFPVNNWICLCSYLCPLVAAVIVAPKKPCAAFFEHSSVKGGVSSDALRSASPILEKVTSVTSLWCLKNQSKKSEVYARAIATPRAIAARSSSEPDSGASKIAKPSDTRFAPKRTASCAQSSIYSPLFQL